MPEPPRAQRYEGLFQSQTKEMFDADARSAAEHDWYPVSQEWTGSVLFVQYEHDPGRRQRIAAPQKPVAAPPPQAAPPDPRGSKSDWPEDGTSNGRRRRVLVGVVVGLVVAALVATTLIGTQLLNRPGFGSQANGPAQTPAPVTVVSSLGSRTAVTDLLKARGYTGAVITLADGREQWRGTDKRGSVAEVIGPEERVTEVSLAVNILRGAKRDNKARNADLDYLFATFAPLAAEWADAEIEATDAGAVRTVESQFGDLTVKLLSMPVQGGSVVKFQIKTD